MLNNAFPSHIWHLFDFFLAPGGSYFAARKANENVHLQYTYTDGSVWAVNSLYHGFSSLSITAELFAVNSSRIWSQSINSVSLGPDQVMYLFSVPLLNDTQFGANQTYFLRLSLSHLPAQQQTLNWYWLSTQSDVLQWDQSNWRMTPCSSYANFIQMRSLPNNTESLSAVIIDTICSFEGGSCATSVQLENQGSSIIFFIQLRLLSSATDDDVLPSFWSDNFVTLLPGESLNLLAEYQLDLLFGGEPQIAVETWNNVFGT